MWTTLIAWGGRLLGGSSSIKWVGAGVAALAVVGVVVWLGWSRAEYRADYEAERAARAQIQTAYEAHEAVLQGLRADIQAQAEALAVRDAKINEINADRQAMRRRLQEAIRHDETVRDWANTPLPAAVRSMLR